MPINLDKLKIQLTKHEGFKLTPYICPAGVWSVGIGRNLEDVGISRAEARELGDAKLAGKVVVRPFGPVLNGRPLGELIFTVPQIHLMFENDVMDRLKRLSLLPWFINLSEVRQRVILDMAFNLGYAGLMGFKQTIEAIKNGNFKLAAENMGRSKWAGQVPVRAKRLCKMMATNLDPDWSKVTF